ncbi:MAG: metallopeptidase family protein [Proteobacteria bacterium]|nr:metallopeptidase family protein [Pseudomonadota bacterium]
MEERFPAGGGNERLDRFLAGKLKGDSRAYCKGLIERGQVTVDGRVRSPDFRLTGAAIIRVRAPEPEWLKSPFDILGLYRGVSLDRKSVGHVPTDLDMIFLYRRPLLDYWVETGEPLWRLVRNVLIHECGHHFGLSDEEMARIEGEA